MRQPLIGITPELQSDGNAFTVSPVYMQVVSRCGGLPVLLPIVPKADIPALFEHLQGLIVTGGNDVDPNRYGEEPHALLGELTPAMDEFELALIEEALDQDKPFLGTCRGMHLLNVVLGGTLYQDIHKQAGAEIGLHLQRAPRSHPVHGIELDPASRFAGILGADERRVNSFHHQALKDVAPDLRVAARAKDGIVEAVESTRHAFAFGVQWHPEEFAVRGDLGSLKLFERMIAAACARMDDDPVVELQAGAL